MCIELGANFNYNIDFKFAIKVHVMIGYNFRQKYLYHFSTRSLKEKLLSTLKTLLLLDVKIQVVGSVVDNKVIKALS